jgi:hypothetical protein
MGLRKLVFRKIAVIVGFCAAVLFACGTKQAAYKAAVDVTLNDTVIITGMAHIYGGESHTFAGIESEDGKIYAVYPPEKEAEIRSLQGRLIEFTLRFLEVPMGEGSLYLKDGTVTPLSWRLLIP